MRFSDFWEQYGEPRAHLGPLQMIRSMAKMVKVPKNRISAMMSSGGPTSPARPVKVTSVAGPMTSPSLTK